MSGSASKDRSRKASGGGRIRTCKRCKFSTSNGKEFLHHQLQEHSTEAIEVYACEKCDYISHAYDDLIQHKRTLHPVTPSKPRNSTTSHATNINTTPVDNRKKEADVIPTVSSPDAFEERYANSNVYVPVTYSCAECSFTTQSAKQYYRHQRDAHGERDLDVFECTRCEFATKTELRLEKHILSHSEEENGDFEYTEGVSEENFVPEGTDEDSSSQGALQIDEDSNSGEHDFKSPLQIVMEMNAANRTMFPSDSKMSSVFLAAMSSKKPVGIPSAAKSRMPPGGGNTATGKPRCTPVREAVDPAKYMTIQEGDGIKYACSKCGNIYKWRKSLNKHWKEKHEGEVPDPRSSAVTALNLPGRLSNNTSNNISHLMGISSNNPQSLLMPSKPGAFRPISSPSVPSPVRPQPMFSTGHFGMGALTRPVVYPSRGSLPLKPMPINDTPFSAASLSSFPTTSPSAPFPPRPVAVSPQATSPGLPQPPAAHGTKPHPFLSPPSSRKSSLSVYDEPFDEQDGVLDLSKKSNPVPEVTPHSPTGPLQDQPIDFSSLSSNSTPPLSSARYPPPPLSTDISRRHLISPHHPGTALSPIVIEPSTPTTTPPSSSSYPHQFQCTVCSYSSSNAQELDVHRQLHREDVVPARHQQRLHQCAECPEAFANLDQLNAHFSIRHMDVLQQKLDEDVMVDEGGGAGLAQKKELYHWLSVDVSHRPPSHTVGQETTCLVCGAYYQWQDSLESHFSMVHPQLPNPYTIRRPVTPTPMEHSLGAVNAPRVSPTPSKSPRDPTTPADITTVTTPDGKVLNFAEDENTAIVIPVAPEDATPITPRKKPGRKSNTVHSLDKGGDDSSAELLLPYKCTVCEYRARWPSEITQHMKNHSDEKPYKCPRCSYRSKWKWDVVKHLKRCGGGTVKDVIDTTKIRRQMHVNAILAGVPSLGASPVLPSSRELSRGPPNVTVVPERKRGESMSSSVDESEDTEGSEVGGALGGGGATGTLPQHFCSQCPFIANSSAELKRHARIHSEDKPYICKTCGYCSKWKCDLKKHLRTYDHQSAVPLTYGGHGRKPADWDKDDERNDQEHGESDDEHEMMQHDQNNFSTIDQPQNHHHKSGVGKLKCKQCDFTADDLPSFLQHKISHQVNSPTKKEMEDSFTPQMKHRRKPLKQDITKTVQEGAEAYACEWCNFTTNQSQELYHHVRSEHAEDTDEMEEKDAEEKENEENPSLYACDFCTWSTDNSTDMYHHIQEEHQQDINGDAADLAEIKIYRGESRKVAKRRLKHCDKCAYVTDNISTLQRHMSKHGKKARYLCNFCDYSVEREHIIEYHMSLVHKDKYLANHNVKVTQNVEDEEEYLDHEDDGYMVQEENSMDEEQLDVNGTDEDNKRRGYSVLQIHQGKRTRYACQKCPYKTENLTNMSNHARQHGANKKFTCEFCDYSLDQLRHIIKHMKTQHGHEAMAMEDDGINDEEKEMMNGFNDEPEEENDENEDLTDISENEWEIAEVDSSIEEDGTPSKRRRLSRISTSSSNSILKYTCKTCGFDTVNKALVAKHHHKDEFKAHEDKFDAKEPNVDINRNMTVHQD